MARSARVGSPPLDVDVPTLRLRLDTVLDTVKVYRV
jgi:hypothetical protein